MKRHTLIRTLDLPQGSNARALAESLTTDFNVASITGSGGEHEVQLVSPAELVVVISASRAQFFRAPIVVDDDDDDFDDEEEPDDPNDIAEEISFFLARRVGLVQDDEDADEDNDATQDDSDIVAQRVIERLLNEGLLELVTPRSRPGIEEFLAHRLANKRVSETLCDDLADAKGVAELYTSDEQLYEIIAACRSKRTVTPSVARDSKPRPTTSAKTTAKIASKAPAKIEKSDKSEKSDKTEKREKSASKASPADKPNTIKPRKTKK